jgi:hypothetical protein
MPVRREQVAAALKYLGDKADVKRRYERLTSLDQPQDTDAIDMALEMGGSLVPGVGPALAARDFERARRADDPAGMAMAGASALPLGKLVGALKGYDPVMREIDVYHGSPHRFEEFDASKIGTGEGAQAYGHGIYLAESPKVAEGYKKAVTQSMTTGAQRRLQAAGGDIDKAIAETEAKLAKYRQGGAKSYADVAEEDLRGLNQYKQSGDWASGNLYTADLPDEMVDRMLEFEMPLEEMPEKLQKVINPLINKLQSQPNPSIFKNIRSVGDVIQYANALKLEPHKELQAVGIPGIKYLDAGSRTKGDGSRNYVVFDENLINIVRKYGIAGAAAMLGASQADVAQAMQQQRPQGLLSGPQ